MFYQSGHVKKHYAKKQALDYFSSFVILALSKASGLLYHIISFMIPFKASASSFERNRPSGAMCGHIIGPHHAIPKFLQISGL
jgi:hypothetical protein